MGVREKRTGKRRRRRKRGRWPAFFVSVFLSECLILVLAGQFDAAVTADGPQSLCWVCSLSNANLQRGFTIVGKLHTQRGKNNSEVLTPADMNGLAVLRVHSSNLKQHTDADMRKVLF